MTKNIVLSTIVFAFVFSTNVSANPAKYNPVYMYNKIVKLEARIKRLEHELRKRNKTLEVKYGKVHIRGKVSIRGRVDIQGDLEAGRNLKVRRDAVVQRQLKVRDKAYARDFIKKR